MKNIYFVTVMIFLIVNINDVNAANWCKVIYSMGATDGEIKAQLSKCKNSDNLFLAINSGFQNSGHLLNSMIAENCDMRRNVLLTSPRKGDPFFTAVCEFRRHILR
tara:strand:- start:152 stop:469 length:318 start_codon:yes stop_codon:yes gene_type:complete